MGINGRKIYLPTIRIFKKCANSFPQKDLQSTLDGLFSVYLSYLNIILFHIIKSTHLKDPETYDLKVFPNFNI